MQGLTWCLILLSLSLCPTTVSAAKSSDDGDKSLNIPASFSSNQKNYKVSVDSDNILNILKKYELDTHLEVVLLGNFDGKSLEHLSVALDQLSYLAASGSSLQFTHEKILFHVSLARQLESPIVDLME